MKRFKARIMQEREAEFIARDIKEAETIVRKSITANDRLLEIVEVPDQQPTEEPLDVA